jgi:hypothetical protein
MKKNYHIIKNIVSRELCEFLTNYSFVRRKALIEMQKENLISPFDNRFGVFGDPQAPKSIYCIYGDPAFDTLLLKLHPVVEKKIKNKLVLNNSYMRIYEKGVTLHRHKDKDRCKVSLTINLGGNRWPIYLEPDTKKGKVKNNIYYPSKSKGIKVELSPGDALIYDGVEMEHWREKLEGDFCVQVFLHYSLKNKETIKTIYDGRKALGLWAALKDIK